MTSGWGLGLSLILFPFLPLAYSLYIISPTPLLLPCYPRTPVTFPVFSIIIPFFSILVFPLLFLPLSCFCYLCLRRRLTAKLAKQCTGFTPNQYFSTVFWTIKSMSTCVSLYIQYTICHLIWPYPAVCLATIHLGMWVRAHWGLHTSSVIW